MREPGQSWFPVRQSYGLPVTNEEGFQFTARDANYGIGPASLNAAINESSFHDFAIPAVLIAQHYEPAVGLQPMTHTQDHALLKVLLTPEYDEVALKFCRQPGR